MCLKGFNLKFVVCSGKSAKTNSKMAATSMKARDTVTLKGSAEIVAEFFSKCLAGVCFLALLRYRPGTVTSKRMTL